MEKKCPVCSDGHRASRGSIPPSEHGRVTSHCKGDDWNIGGVVQPERIPESGNAKGENHRLCHEPEHADVVTPEASDDLAHHGGV